MPKFEIKHNTRGVKREYTKLIKRMKNKTVALKKVSIFLDQWVQRNFVTEGKSVGGWKPFMSGGRKLKGGKVDSSAKLLRDTGALRLSFSPFSNNTTAGIGSDLDRSKWHNEGTKKGLPARRMLPRQKEVMLPVRAILKAHITKVISR